MLIMGLESPDGDITYIAGAFPSACGKTNLAMLKSPFEADGWKVWTIGEDIAWINVGPDGRLWAINPESGYFGVAPGTNRKTNPNAMAAVSSNSIFTNVAMTEQGGVWWEGMDGPVPERLTDWQGHPWTPASGTRAAHPNSRFTTPAIQNPALSPHWEDPQGVPLSPILFGGRRARTVPLIYRSFDWEHGVFLGATMASETTAAATGAVGVVRRDPMAMLPFIGYNAGDYFAHWIEVGKSADAAKLPKIFYVNWFRRDAEGKFSWPGFGENIRVLKWALERIEGKAAAVDTPIGRVPTPEALDTDGLSMTPGELATALTVDAAEWRAELPLIEEWFDKIGGQLPTSLRDELEALRLRLDA